VHLTHRVVVADLLHYRMETLLGRAPKKPGIMACDGSTQYRLFADRLVTAAAAPPELGLARMIDPSWLLARAELTVHGWTELAGRRVLRLTAEPLRSDVPDAAFLFPHVELLLDEEFGVLLRLTAFQDTFPAEAHDKSGVKSHDNSQVKTQINSQIKTQSKDQSPVQDKADDRSHDELHDPAPVPERIPVARVELRELSAADPAPAEFRLEPPANGHTVTDRGGPLGESTLPAPLKAAAEAAATLAGGAVMLAGILGRNRKPQDPQDPQ
jgi:hypothetical protein